jgi:hypothetical protein
MSESRAVRFWKSFSSEAADISEWLAAGHLRKAFDRVEALLLERGFDFCFDLSRDGPTAILILTPEGDQGVAAEIDELLAVAPMVPGWRLVGRRQRKGIADAITIVHQIYGVDVTGVSFDVAQSSSGLSVVMFSHALEGMSQEVARGLAQTFLDHAIGESLVMERITVIETSASGAGHRSAESLVEALESH